MVWWFWSRWFSSPWFHPPPSPTHPQPRGGVNVNVGPLPPRLVMVVITTTSAFLLYAGDVARVYFQLWGFSFPSRFLSFVFLSLFLPSVLGPFAFKKFIRRGWPRIIIIVQFWTGLRQRCGHPVRRKQSPSKEHCVIAFLRAFKGQRKMDADVRTSS